MSKRRSRPSVLSIRWALVGALPATVGGVLLLACTDHIHRDSVRTSLGDGRGSGSGSIRGANGSAAAGGSGGQGAQGGQGAGADGGAGGEDGSCDGAGFCDVCAQCAVVGTCVAEQVACDDDIACSQAMLCLEQCNTNCLAEPACYQTCKATCEIEQPVGFADAVDTLACWCAGACMDDCSAYTTTDCLAFAP